MSAANAMRDETMDEILASIHRMIADGNAAPSAGGGRSTATEPKPETHSAAADGTEDWMAAQVAAVLGETVRSALGGVRSPEPIERRVGRRFVDGLGSGPEDVALVAAAGQKVETTMSEQQRATVSAVRPEAVTRGASDGATRAGADPRDEDRLLSDQTNGAVGASFETLSRTILSQNPRTLEDLVRDLLRPMLRTWLDQNLPRMVERLVKQEIDRISRGER
jgi:hypothetical protein